MANTPRPINVRSETSGKDYTVAVHTASGGFVADVLRHKYVVGKTSTHPTPDAAQTAGKKLAHTL